MPNLSEFPTGAALLDQLGGIYRLEEQIGLHTIFATERGFGGDIPGLAGTANLPGVSFRFSGSCVNYCKALQDSDGCVHFEFNNSIRIPEQQIIRIGKSVRLDCMKAVFLEATGLYLG